MDSYLDEVKAKVGDHTATVEKRLQELRKSKKKLLRERDHLVMDRAGLRESLSPQGELSVSIASTVGRLLSLKQQSEEDKAREARERRAKAEAALALVEKKIGETKHAHALVNDEIKAIVAATSNLLVEVVGRITSEALNDRLGAAVIEVAGMINDVEVIIDDTAGTLGLNEGDTLPARQRIGAGRGKLDKFSRGL